MKLNSKLQLTAFFMSILMLTACGGGDSAPNPATPAVAPQVTPRITPRITPQVTTPVTPPSQSLKGSWSTQCQASKALDGYDEQDTFNFKGNTLTTNKTFYNQNTNCKHSEEALRAREVAGIKLGAEVNPGTDTGHTKIDITPSKVILAPMNYEIQNLFKTVNDSIYNGYGLTGWFQSIWQDISSIDAARKNFKIGDLNRDIFQISEEMVDGTTHKVLKLGSHGGNTDSVGRPIVIANRITAIKQQKTTSEQTAQAAGLTGTWKYACRKAKGNLFYWQHSTLNFNGNKLIIATFFYVGTPSKCVSNKLLFEVETKADIVVGKVINKGAANEHTQIGIKTTMVKIKIYPNSLSNTKGNFNTVGFYHTHLQNLYYGYGETNWQDDIWKNISDIPDAIENLNIGTQVPDIFKISTVTTDNLTHTVLKMGDYKGSFDIDGRPLSLEPEGAVRQ